jgi:uncharacterized protein YceH (UPF0502 family)
MKASNMSETQINTELLVRGSRTHGSLQQKEDRLQRFLDFENQKERRNQYVQQVKAEAEAEAEMDGQQEAELECCETCECNQARAHVQTEEERVARVLLNLQDDAERSEYYINHLIPRMKAVEEAFADLDESYEAVVGENLRLNHRINNLETRLSHLENRSDSPPPLIFADSNPNWQLDTAFTTYTSSPAL